MKRREHISWPALLAITATLLSACEVPNVKDDAAPGVSTENNTSNRPPIAEDQNLGTNEDEAIEVTLLARDPEDDATTYVILAPPSHGQISALSGDLLTYTPASNFSGEDSFSFKANDGQQDSASATVKIQISSVNDEPVASSQNLVTPNNRSASISLAGADADNDSLTFSIVQATSNGTLSRLTEGQYVYQPNSGYFGVDSFTFVAHDGSSDSEPSTVSLDVRGLAFKVYDANLNEVSNLSTIDLGSILYDVNAPAGSNDFGRTYFVKNTGNTELKLTYSYALGPYRSPNVTLVAPLWTDVVIAPGLSASFEMKVIANGGARRLTLAVNSTNPAMSLSKNYTFNAGTRSPQTLSIVESAYFPIQPINGRADFSGTCQPGYLIYNSEGNSTTCSMGGSFQINANFQPSDDFATSLFVTLNQKATATSPAGSSASLSSRIPERISHLRALKDRVLIVYNRNVLGADQLANYYAQARGIQAERICGIEIEPGLYAKSGNIDLAIDHVLTDCLCPLVPQLERPQGCGPNHAEQIELKANTDHFVFMRGIPARVVWPAGDPGAEEPPFGWYFSRYLYSRPDGRRSIHENFYGHVEAVTHEKTIDLIDRTMKAEQTGFEGAGVADNYLTNASYNLLNAFAEGDTPACLGNLNISSGAKMDTSQCQFGYNSTGTFPHGGQFSSGKVIDMGFYDGTNPWPNNQIPFNGNFNSALSWRKSSNECTTRCADFASPTDQAFCRSESTDYFKEINTACVGGSASLMGFQLRSWPVTFYGFLPNGWDYYGWGNADQVQAHILTDPVKAFSNPRFVDAKYIRLGEPRAQSMATCYGSACPEQLATAGMQRHFRLSQPLTNLGGQVRARFVVRYRNAPNGDKVFKGSLTVRNNSTTPVGESSAFSIPLASGNEVAWTEFSSDISLQGVSDSIPITYFTVLLDNPLSANLTGFIELDAIEILDLNNANNSVLEANAGSFNEELSSVASGTYAANMIDRLGAVAWWGSSSHFRTGGWAYANSQLMIANFFRGEGLGRSVTSARGLESGLLFGDPLYTPAAAALDLVSSSGIRSVVQAYVSNPYALNRNPNIVISSQPRYSFRSGSEEKIVMKAFNGSNFDDALVWKVEKCLAIEDPYLCNSQNAWSSVAEGTHAVRTPVEVISNLMSLVSNPANAESITLRLIVYRAAQPDKKLQSLLTLRYSP